MKICTEFIQRAETNPIHPANACPTRGAMTGITLQGEITMSDTPVTIVLPSGGSRNAEVPNDVPVKELLPELTTSLELPTTGPDGRPVSYRLDSKALGRELKEVETLSQAGVPEGDRLMMTADVTAG
jgi:WXG100 protein secretion system (Wss), protein YukD